jgi:hypothetical protein
MINPFRFLKFKKNNYWVGGGGFWWREIKEGGRGFW